MSRSSPPVPPALVVGLRLALLVLSAGALVVAAFARSSPDSQGARSGERYACPMHPEVKDDAPGSCPVCGMALERVSRSAASAQAGLSPQDLGVVTRRLVVGGDRRVPSFIESEGVAAAVVPDEVLRTMRAGEPGIFIGSRPPAVRCPVHLLPARVPWDDATSRVHFRVDRSGPGVSAPLGEVGDVVLRRPATEELVVPSTAVLEGPDGAYVIATSPDGLRFFKRPVKTGSVFSGLTVVLSGVRDQEIIVGRNTFFPDAERRGRPPAGVGEAVP